MSNQKKRIIALAGLLVALFVTAVLNKNISIFEYICLFANAALYLTLAFSSQSLIEEQSRRILRQSGVIFHFMTSGGFHDIMKKVEALPKVISATGQIYVDYEDVMKIIRGEELIEK